MSLTPIIAPFLRRRARQIDRYATEAESIQRGVLQRLLRCPADTEWGRLDRYNTLRNYEDFARTVPVCTY